MFRNSASTYSIRLRIIAASDPLQKDFLNWKSCPCVQFCAVKQNCWEVNQTWVLMRLPDMYWLYTLWFYQCVLVLIEVCKKILIYFCYLLIFTIDHKCQSLIYPFEPHSLFTYHSWTPRDSPLSNVPPAPITNQYSGHSLHHTKSLPYITTRCQHASETNNNLPLLTDLRYRARDGAGGIHHQVLRWVIFAPLGCCQRLWWACVWPHGPRPNCK